MAGLILTVTPNPALDVTYRLDRLSPGTVHRVDEVAEHAGGKGVNVARVLNRLGRRCEALVIGSGATADRIAAELGAEGVRVTLLGRMEVRRTLVVQGDDGTTTSLWEPGTAPEDPEAAGFALLAEVEQHLGGLGALTVSGSLPPGMAADLPARIAGMAAARDVPVVLDVDGAALTAAVAAGHAVITPNTDELERLTGRRPGSAPEVVALAEDLTACGVPMVVATLGADGLVVSRRGTASVHGRLAEPVTGNPTGAGDAVCAAVAASLAEAGSVAEVDLPDLARSAVATGAAAVLRPVAGEVDPADVVRLLDLVVVETV